MSTPWLLFMVLMAFGLGFMLGDQHGHDQSEPQRIEFSFRVPAKR